MNQATEVLSGAETERASASDAELARQMMEVASTGHKVWTSIPFAENISEAIARVERIAQDTPQ